MTANATTPLGSNVLSVKGIKVLDDATGGLTIQAHGSGNTTQTLLLGNQGIDLGFASQNLTINKANAGRTLGVTLGTAQTWIAGNARTLTVNADVTANNNQLTLANRGSGVIALQGATNMGSGTLVIDKQGTGAINVTGALTAGVINATNTNSGNVSFGGGGTAVVNVPVLNLTASSTGGYFFVGATTATGGVNFNGLGTNTLQFSSTLTTSGGNLNATTTNSGALTFVGAVNLGSGNANLNLHTGGATQFQSNLTANSLIINSTKGGAMTFTGALTAPTVTINTKGAGGLTFGNANSVGTSGLNASTALTINSIGASNTLFNSTVISPTINISTAGSLTMSRAVSGTNLTFTTWGGGAASFGETVTAASVLNFTANNNSATTFTGIVTAPTFNLTNRGTSAVTANGIVAATAINITNDSTGVINLNGPISGAGTLNIVNNSTSNATVIKLAGNNTFTGATSVIGGTLQLDLATANNNKLSNTAALTLNRAIVNITGPASGGVQEEVGNLVLSGGYSRITRSAGTGTMRVNQITRSAGAVLDMGAAGIADTDRTNTNGIIGGWATINNGTDWAINATNAANGLLNSLGTYTTQNTVTSWTTPSQNLLVNITSGNTTGTLPTGTTTINSLKIDNGTGTTNINVAAQTGGSTLVIDSGGVIVRGTGTGGTKTIGTTGANITAGTLTNATAFHHIINFTLGLIASNKLTLLRRVGARSYIAIPLNTCSDLHECRSLLVPIRNWEVSIRQRLMVTSCPHRNLGCWVRVVDVFLVNEQRIKNPSIRNSPALGRKRGIPHVGCQVLHIHQILCKRSSLQRMAILHWLRQQHRKQVMCIVHPLNFKQHLVIDNNQLKDLRVICVRTRNSIGAWDQPSIHGSPIICISVLHRA